jgi:hypothetical protein
MVFAPIYKGALDSVRVIGNNAVHQGLLHLKDDTGIALRLFKLVNVIVEDIITMPREIDSIYRDLPEEAKNGIERRDRNKVYKANQ